MLADERAWRRNTLYMDVTGLTGASQDNSGTIERDEFLSLPQISSNPLATRSVISPCFAIATS